MYKIHINLLTLHLLLFTSTQTLYTALNTINNQSITPTKKRIETLIQSDIRKPDWPENQIEITLSFAFLSHQPYKNSYQKQPQQTLQKPQEKTWDQFLKHINDKQQSTIARMQRRGLNIPFQPIHHHHYAALLHNDTNEFFKAITILEKAQKEGKINQTCTIHNIQYPSPRDWIENLLHGKGSLSRYSENQILILMDYAIKNFYQNHQARKQLIFSIINNENINEMSLYSISAQTLKYLIEKHGLFNHHDGEKLKHDILYHALSKNRRSFILVYYQISNHLKQTQTYVNHIIKQLNQHEKENLSKQKKNIFFNISYKLLLQQKALQNPGVIQYILKILKKEKYDQQNLLLDHLLHAGNLLYAKTTYNTNEIYYHTASTSWSKYLLIENTFAQHYQENHLPIRTTQHISKIIIQYTRYHYDDILLKKPTNYATNKKTQTQHTQLAQTFFAPSITLLASSLTNK